MDFRTSAVAQTYAHAAKAAPAQPKAGADGGLGALVGGFAETLGRHEATARAAMTGGADPHALVEALASSQLAVETVATVRDRVVEAYQEILRMPV
jgi:flagellar hook-basal body complex protein FliE